MAYCFKQAVDSVLSDIIGITEGKGTALIIILLECSKGDGHFSLEEEASILIGAEHLIHINLHYEIISASCPNIHSFAGEIKAENDRCHCWVILLTLL